MRRYSSTFCPLTASVRLKWFAGVPRSDIVEGVRAMRVFQTRKVGRANPDQ